MDKLFMRWMPIALAVLFLAGCQFWNVKRHVTIGEMIYTVDMREEDHVKFDDGKVKFEVDGRGRPGIIEQAFGAAIMNLPDIEVDK